MVYKLRQSCLRALLIVTLLVVVQLFFLLQRYGIAKSPLLYAVQQQNPPQHLSNVTSAPQFEAWSPIGSEGNLFVDPSWSSTLQRYDSINECLRPFLLDISADVEILSPSKTNFEELLNSQHSIGCNGVQLDNPVCWIYALQRVQVSSDALQHAIVRSDLSQAVSASKCIMTATEPSAAASSPAQAQLYSTAECDAALASPSTRCSCTLYRVSLLDASRVTAFAAHEDAADALHAELLCGRPAPKADKPSRRVSVGSMEVEIIVGSPPAALSPTPLYLQSPSAASGTTVDRLSALLTFLELSRSSPDVLWLQPSTALHELKHGFLLNCIALVLKHRLTPLVPGGYAKVVLGVASWTDVALQSRRGRRLVYSRARLHLQHFRRLIFHHFRHWMPQTIPFVQSRLLTLSPRPFRAGRVSFMNNPSSPGLALIAESARLLHFQMAQADPDFEPLYVRAVVMRLSTVLVLSRLDFFDEMLALEPGATVLLVPDPQMKSSLARARSINLFEALASLLGLSTVLLPWTLNEVGHGVNTSELLSSAYSRWVDFAPSSLPTLSTQSNVRDLNWFRGVQQAPGNYRLPTEAEASTTIVIHHHTVASDLKIVAAPSAPSASTTGDWLNLVVNPSEDTFVDSLVSVSAFVEAVKSGAVSLPFRSFRLLFATPPASSELSTLLKHAVCSLVDECHGHAQDHAYALDDVVFVRQTHQNLPTQAEGRRALRQAALQHHHSHHHEPDDHILPCRILLEADFIKDAAAVAEALRHHFHLDVSVASRRDDLNKQIELMSNAGVVVKASTNLSPLMFLREGAGALLLGAAGNDSESSFLSMSDIDVLPMFGQRHQSVLDNPVIVDVTALSSRLQRFVDDNLGHCT